MGAWLNSSTHKSNLLSKNFTEAGVGIVKGKWKNKETYFIVQFYAKPKGAAPPAKYQAKDAKPPKITSIRISPENLKKYQLNIKLV
ncbi:MAG TPA: hypothetical protein DIT25_03295 [Candidatus Moranbacteria bacterium]|nr:hypothetical protein [Candidatus Moranbacteria bacterium]